MGQPLPPTRLHVSTFALPRTRQSFDVDLIRRLADDNHLQDAEAIAEALQLKDGAELDAAWPVRPSKIVGARPNARFKYETSIRRYLLMGGTARMIGCRKQQLEINLAQAVTADTLNSGGRPAASLHSLSQQDLDLEDREGSRQPTFLYHNLSDDIDSDALSATISHVDSRAEDVEGLLEPEVLAGFLAVPGVESVAVHVPSLADSAWQRKPSR